MRLKDISMMTMFFVTYNKGELLLLITNTYLQGDLVNVIKEINISSFSHMKLRPAHQEVLFPNDFDH